MRCGNFFFSYVKVNEEWKEVDIIYIHFFTTFYLAN